jgi:amidophosphoribosyltransferase
MATYRELIANQFEDVESIRAHVGADSLAYLSIEGLLSAVRVAMPQPESGHCSACFSGDYPIRIPKWLFSDDREKLIFEDVWGS